MRLRIEVTQADIAKAKAYRWPLPLGQRCPVHRAIVRQTGCHHVEVGYEALTVCWGRSASVSSCRYAFPPQVSEQLRRYHQATGLERQMEPFEFDLELDARGAKLLCLNRPCSRCQDYPRERGGELCVDCQRYRDTIQRSWR